MALDWQFLVVTVVALGAAGVIVRRFLPARRSDVRRPADPSCAHCPSNQADERRARPARTETTPVVLLRDLRK